MAASTPMPTPMPTRSSGSPLLQAVAVLALPTPIHRRRQLLVALVSLVVAVALVVTAVLGSGPAPTLGATTMTAKCTSNLRTRATTSSRLRVTIPAGTRLVVTATVTGGRWAVSCGGRSSSNRWYRISSINGKSVKARYGITYLYIATGLARTYVAPTPTPTPKPTPSPTPTPAPTPTPSPTPTWIEGIDVSHWQGTINWTKVAAAGKRFAFLKASEATDYVDTTYPTNRARANAAGILVGAYHFARPAAPLSSVTAGGDGTAAEGDAIAAQAVTAAEVDAIAEADHFVGTAAPRRGDLLPVLDLETTGGLDVPTLQVWVRAFMERVHERTGIRAMIYVSPSFWKTYMGDTRWFADNGYPVLWIAHWTTATQPAMPASNWGGDGWTFWQYTSSGHVDGIGDGVTTRVDLNRYRYKDFTPALVP